MLHNSSIQQNTTSTKDWRERVLRSGAANVALLEIFYNDNRRSYYFIRCSELQLSDLNTLIKESSDFINIDSYGEVLKSGWGKTPDKWLEKYGF